MFRVEYKGPTDSEWVLWAITPDKVFVNNAVRMLRSKGVEEISVSETRNKVVFHWERSNGTLIKD